jgi:hypothetical protein
MKYTFKDGIYILDQFGCYVKVEDGTVYTAPILNGEERDFDWTEVTDPAPGFFEALRHVE